MMNHFITQLKLRLRRYKFLLLWKVEFISYPKKSIKPGTVLDLESIKKPLILVPHADDELIGNSMLLQHFKNELDVYYFQFLGKNTTETNKKIRLDELTKIQQRFNFSLFNSSSYDYYDDLEALLSNTNYTDIFLPFPIDWHTEHIKVNTIMLPILEKLGLQKKVKLHFYHISVPLPAEVPFHYIGVSKQDLAEKQQLFSSIYKSQYNTPIRRVNYQNQINAIGSSHYAKENYARLDFEEWKYLLKFVDENYSAKINPLVFTIDNIKQTRELASDVYLEWKKK